jgi:hypothetical protein
VRDAAERAVTQLCGRMKLTVTVDSGYCTRGQGYLFVVEGASKYGQTAASLEYSKRQTVIDARATTRGNSGTMRNACSEGPNRQQSDGFVCYGCLVSIAVVCRAALEVQVAHDRLPGP